MANFFFSGEARLQKKSDIDSFGMIQVDPQP